MPLSNCSSRDPEQNKNVYNPTFFTQKAKGGCFPSDQPTSFLPFGHPGGVARTVSFEQNTVHSSVQ